MKEIVINSRIHGIQTVLLDDEDFERLSKLPWYIVKNSNRLYVRFGRQDTPAVFIHHMVMNIAGSRRIQVDHIDLDTLNNQKKNLRLCTPRQNSANRGRRSDSKKKYKGVFKKKGRHGKLITTWGIEVGGKPNKKTQNGFKTEEAAARAYDKMALEMYGEFAQLNFPKGLLPAIYVP